MDPRKTVRLLIGLLLWLASCTGEKAGPHAAAGDDCCPPGTQAQGTKGAPQGHDHESEHGRADEKPSDLDRSAEDLFALECEHKVKTHACDECRYEVGVVKATERLVKDGLFKVVKAQKRPVTRSLDLNGEVQFDERRVAHIRVPVEGVIRRVRVNLGDRVAQGEALFDCESTAVGEAQAGIREAQGLVAVARRNHERLAALQKEAIASEKEVSAARQEWESAELRLAKATGRLSQLGVAPSEAAGTAADSASGHFAVRAPVAGIILDLHAVAGEILRSEEPLATVGDPSSLWIWADVYERDVALVSEEQGRGPLAALVSVQAYPGREFPGVVDLVGPSIHRATRTAKVRLVVANEGTRLMAGMFANVRLLLPGNAQVLALPQSAVLADAGRLFVFVHRYGDYWLRRPVEIGRKFAGFVELTRGLRGDESVVADGAFLMKSDVLRSKMGAGCAD